MPILKANFLRRLMNEQGADGGDAGGGEIAPEVQALIDKAVSAATAGLKTNNAALLAEKKSIQDRLKQFGDADPEAVHSILKRFTDDEEAGLIKAGKIDEVLAKRTERMSVDHAKSIKAEQEARAKAEALAGKLSANALAKAVTDAAIKAGARPDAVRHIASLASSAWKLDENAEPVSMNGDEIVLGKDGKSRLSLDEWMVSFLDENPLFRPPSQGTNAPGSLGANGGKTIRQEALDRMKPAERAAFFTSGGTVVG
jgi:hypothetical protein